MSEEMPDVFYAVNYIGEYTQGKWSTANMWGDRGSLCIKASKVKQDLLKLVAEWEAWVVFMDNPHDSETDRACGRTYRECADELKRLLKVINNE